MHRKQELHFFSSLQCVFTQFSASAETDSETEIVAEGADAYSEMRMTRSLNLAGDQSRQSC
jgi:hypothetical protein